jgi:ubiquinone/menaquinone biosynthesis C-methylase UbiE
MRPHYGPLLLNLADDTFDAAMTTFSVHQWGDFKAGLREMRRVARGHPKVKSYARSPGLSVAVSSPPCCGEPVTSG